MSAGPLTRNSLILRIRNRDDAESWREFVAVYEPVIYRTARKRGLQHADSMELVQRVLLAVARAVDRFQPDSKRARFRTWLFRITHNEFCKQIAGQRKQEVVGDTKVNRILDDVPASETADDFTLEYRRSVFRWAAERVQSDFRSSTWNAFYRTAVECEPVEQVARDLGISVGAIYVARSRVMARLQQEARRYEELNQ